MNLGLSPCLSAMEQMKDKEHDEQQQQDFNFGLNHQIVSSWSSSSASCRIFFNPSEDHMGLYHPQLYQPQDEYYGYHRGSSSYYEMGTKVENGVKVSLWKEEDEAQDGVKWISSKMKKHDRVAEAAKVEVKKVMMPSSSVETDLSSSYNCNAPTRVCSDCHTTKTPLWRSGPKGPKSLCNACGIRQRKARRAMAAAANGGGASPPPRAMKVKEKLGKASQLKKRCKVGGGGSSTSSSGKKMDFEDFLINLSNKLAVHRVFPQDEKEAAILLMALSSGLVHG